MSVVIVINESNECVLLFLNWNQRITKHCTKSNMYTVHIHRCSMEENRLVKNATKNFIRAIWSLDMATAMPLYSIRELNKISWRKDSF